MTEGHFKKELGLFDAIAIVAGSMVGTGIFIVSSDIARQINSGFLLLVIWLIAGLMAIIGGLCYGEYAAAWPQAGGQYIYLKNIWGKRIGFLYGWVLFLVIQTGTVAAVSVGFAKFANVLFPVIDSDNVIFAINHFKITTVQVLAIGTVAFLTYINTLGMKMGVIIQNVFTATKYLALFGVVICGLFVGLNWDIIHQNFALSTLIPQNTEINLFSLMGICLVGALFASDAWYNVTFIASEIKKPEKNIPRALIFGIGSVILLYLLINFSYLAVLTLDQIKNSPEDIVGAALMGTIFGGVGKFIIAIIIMISAFGCANGCILSGARVYYAMAKDGLFFKPLAHLDPKTNVPVNALLIQGVWSCFLILSGSYSQLLDYVIFASLIFYILTIGGIFRFRRKWIDIERPYKTPFYPVLPAIYCLLAIFICINLLIYKPLYSWAGVILLLMGIPVYYVRLYFNRNKKV